MYYYFGADPWERSIAKLIEELGKVSPSYQQNMFPLKEKGLMLDRFYIPSRYPNGLPDLRPTEAYIRTDAEGAIQKAREILEAVWELFS